MPVKATFLILAAILASNAALASGKTVTCLLNERRRRHHDRVPSAGAEADRCTSYTNINGRTSTECR